MITTIANIRNDPRTATVARPLFEMREAMGGTIQILFRAARAGFIAKNRAVMVDFFEDEMRELRWYLDTKNHDEAVQIVSTFTKIPVASMQDWLFTTKDIYRDPNLLPDLDSLARNLKTQKEAGFLASDIDVPNFADLSLVKEAAVRIR